MGNPGSRLASVSAARQGATLANREIQRSQARPRSGPCCPLPRLTAAHTHPFNFNPLAACILASCPSADDHEGEHDDDHDDDHPRRKGAASSAPASSSTSGSVAEDSLSTAAGTTAAAAGAAVKPGESCPLLVPQRCSGRPRPSCTLPFCASMPACKPRLALLHLPRPCASRHPPAVVKRPTPAAASKGAVPFSDWVSHVMPNDAWLMMSFVVAWFCGEWGCFVKGAWGGVHQVACVWPMQGSCVACRVG